MVKLKIDNRIIEVEDGTRLITAARSLAIDIPSLCFKEGLPHYTSCMVCMVKDVKNNKFIPACSAMVEEGQEIDTLDLEVSELRRESLSLLLTEHRAECEAPCKNVCPDGLNIPLMNRFLAKGDIESALKVISETLNSPGSKCDNCPGYCEKACRRKMIDKTISIRSLIKYTLGSEYIKIQDQGTPAEKKKLFNSTIGKIEDNEKKEWLKECPDNALRYENPANHEEVISEASNCMHCDCRALEECELRQLCDKYTIKNPKRLRTGHPIEKKINSINGLIFENAKCIKCGLCVRLIQDSTKAPALCFTGRGFMSLISEPLTVDFDSILKGGINDIIEICPTGALSKK